MAKKSQNLVWRDHSRVIVGIGEESDVCQQNDDTLHPLIQKTNNHQQMDSLLANKFREDWVLKIQNITVFDVVKLKIFE